MGGDRLDEPSKITKRRNFPSNSFVVSVPHSTVDNGIELDDPTLT